MSAPPRAPSGTSKKKNRSNTLKPSFKYRAQQAALMESANIASTSRVSTSRASRPQFEASNRSFLNFNFDDTNQTNVQTHYIDSDIPTTLQHVIHTSNYPSDFMRTSPISPPLNTMESSTSFGELSTTDPPLITIVPAFSPTLPSVLHIPYGETDTFGTNRDSFTESTTPIDRTVNKNRTAQGNPIASTPLAQPSEPQPIEQSPPTTNKAPEIIYLDSSNS